MKHPAQELIHLYINGNKLHEAAIIAYWKNGDEFHLDNVKEAIEKVKASIADFEAKIEGEKDTSEAAA